jgi:two-component system alkaline phosphatase synthesis response regulator PhoP
MKKKTKILLVEDDPMIVRLYKRKLMMDGFSVTLAFNGEEGLAELEKALPDIILLDIMMPKMNGLEALRKIKADKRFKNLPVVILTNLGDRPDDIERSKAMGADDYWVKVNIRIQDLTTMINGILSRHAK